MRVIDCRVGVELYTVTSWSSSPGHIEVSYLDLRAVVEVRPSATTIRQGCSTGPVGTELDAISRSSGRRDIEQARERIAAIE
jgi:hypothetical protein